MAKTKYQKEHGNFSNRAHLTAREKVYPKIFNTNSFRDLIFEKDTLLEDSQRGHFLDGEMGVDRVIRVVDSRFKNGLEGIPCYIQERFREPEYFKFQDLTITAWNEASNTRSELYKINADYFVYGYYNELNNDFLDVICINVTLLKEALRRKTIEFVHDRNPKKQTFVGFQFTALKRAGVITYWKNDPAHKQKIKNKEFIAI
ncbi:MAG: hypothetical protein ACOCQR_01645 [bacterium]